jgi:hypothetical protein
MFSFHQLRSSYHILTIRLSADELRYAQEKTQGK